MTKLNSATPRRVVFQYLVPVHVEVEDGLVCTVTVIDETPVKDPTFVEGHADYLDEAVKAADDGQSWPSWAFGYQPDLLSIQPQQARPPRRAFSFQEPDMPTYTIETTYRVPVYRQRTYDAATPAEACRQAIDDDDWSNDKLDYEAAGETYVIGIWLGANAAYSGAPVPVPSHFDETIQRKAAHFEVMFGLLKIVIADQIAERRTDAYWLARANAAVARAEAILAGARDPDEPVAAPWPCHVLAQLQEDRVRHQIAAIIETDPDFEGLTPDAVSDDDVHAACLSVAANTDLAEEIGAAEYCAALAVLRAAKKVNGG